MNIKHWQGYGIVKATKLSNTTRKATFEEEYTYGVENIKKLIIKVEGDHEWGIENDDTYTVHNWLVKKFDKSVTNYMAIKDVKTSMDYSKAVSTCIYTIIIES